MAARFFFVNPLERGCDRVAEISNNNNGNFKWHLYGVAICPLKSRSNWNLEMLAFEERGKPDYPEENLSEQRREPTTNSTHIWRRVRESIPSHIGGRRVLSPLDHPCSLNIYISDIYAKCLSTCRLMW